jgi:hypothetical protein
MFSRLDEKSRERLAAWISPFAVFLPWSIVLQFERYTGRAGMFFAAYVMVVIGYPTMFFLALPSWRDTKERDRVCWTRSIAFGAMFGALVPLLLTMLIACSALIQNSANDLKGVAIECFEMISIGIVMGAAVACVFHLIAADPKIGKL